MSNNSVTATRPSASLRRDLPGLVDMTLGTAVILIPFISWGETPWITGPFVIFMAGAFLAVLYGTVRNGDIQIPSTPVWIPLAMAAGLALFHLPWSPVPYGSLLFLAHLCIAVTFYWLWWSRGSFPAPSSVVFLWTGILVPWVAVEALVAGSGSRGGPFLNPNYTATVLLVCMATAVGSALPVRERVARTAVMLATALLCSAGLMIIGSRSAGLGMILLWASFFILREGRLRWVAIGMIAIVLFWPSTIRYRVIEVPSVDPHAFSRLQIWEASLKMGADHPLIGVGPGLFYEHGPAYAFPTEELPVRYGRIARKPHSEYLRSWAEGGVIGIAAAGLFLFAVLRMIIPALTEGRAGPLLSMGILLYQALFHDITEVLAIIVVGSWCLAQITPAKGRTLSVRDGPGRAGAVAACALVLCLALMVNLDLASRSLWLKGKRLIDSDLDGAVTKIETATVLNPLLPGASRDLALARLLTSRRYNDEKGWKEAERSILRARRFNRLDTAPLRLRAALYTDIARHRPEAAGRALVQAAGDLEMAVTLEPHNALILYNLSKVYWDLGQRKRAVDLLEKTLTKEPNYLQAHKTRISWLATVDPESVPGAEKEMARARERASGYKPLSEYEETILR